MLQNAYFLAKIGADTAENEQHLIFAEILPEIGRADRAPRVLAQGLERVGHRSPGARGRLARPSGAACAKKGASGRMQRPPELVPIA